MAGTLIRNQRTEREKGEEEGRKDREEQTGTAKQQNRTEHWVHRKAKRIGIRPLAPVQE